MRFLKSLSSPLDPAVFGELPELPDNPDADALRRNLKRAQQLLNEAGWQVDTDGVLKNAQGQAFRFEVLGDAPAFERLATPWIHNLARLGIRVRQRMVDPALYQKRVSTFDYDVVTTVYPMSSTPGNELLQMLGSAAANDARSGNYAGVADPAVDEIIERILQVRSRDELQLATRALDRVLRHGWYMVPQFHSSSYRVAFDWRLRHPGVLPLFYDPQSWLLETWWRDDEARPVPVAEQADATDETLMHLPALTMEQPSQPAGVSAIGHRAGRFLTC